MCKKPDVRLTGKIKEYEKEIDEEIKITVPHLNLRSIHRKIKKTIFPEKQ